MVMKNASRTVNNNDIVMHFFSLSQVRNSRHSYCSVTITTLFSHFFSKKCNNAWTEYIRRPSCVISQDQQVIICLESGDPQPFLRNEWVSAGNRAWKVEIRSPSNVRSVDPQVFLRYEWRSAGNHTWKVEIRSPSYVISQDPQVV